MPRSLSKEGVRHPLNSENSEFSHSLGRERTVAPIQYPIQFPLFAKAKIEAGQNE